VVGRAERAGSPTAKFERVCLCGVGSALAVMPTETRACKLTVQHLARHLRVGQPVSFDTEQQHQIVRDSLYGTQSPVECDMEYTGSGHCMVSALMC
jgi:hypothetical protein